MRCVRISPYTASHILNKYEDEFFEVVNAKLNLPRLKRKKVITEKLQAEIESFSNENVTEILFDHMKRNADVTTLTEYCKMAVQADAFPKMQKLGKKMLNDLSPEGLLGSCMVVWRRSRIDVAVYQYLCPNYDIRWQVSAVYVGIVVVVVYRNTTEK